MNIYPNEDYINIINDELYSNYDQSEYNDILYNLTSVEPQDVNFSYKYNNKDSNDSYLVPDIKFNYNVSEELKSLFNKLIPTELEDNVCIAGESVLVALIGSKNKLIESLDIELFIFGVNDIRLIYNKLIEHCCNLFREPFNEKAEEEKEGENKSEVLDTYFITKYENFTTIEYNNIPFKIKIMHRRSISPSEIVLKIAIDCCCLCWYKGKFYVSPRGNNALITGVNYFNIDKLCKDYELHLIRYLNMGFKVFIPFFSWKDIMNDRQRLLYHVGKDLNLNAHCLDLLINLYLNPKVLHSKSDFNEEELMFTMSCCKHRTKIKVLYPKYFKESYNLITNIRTTIYFYGTINNITSIRFKHYDHNLNFSREGYVLNNMILPLINIENYGTISSGIELLCNTTYKPSNSVKMNLNTWLEDKPELLNDKEKVHYIYNKNHNIIHESITRDNNSNNIITNYYQGSEYIQVVSSVDENSLKIDFT